MKKHYFISEMAIIIYLAVFKIIFHLLLPEYGYFRDEYYYISIADQFSFTNLDMLPLSPLYLKLIIFILGYSIKTIHFASSFLGALSLVITCLISKELGGKKYAIFLTGLFMIFSGFLPFGSIFSYDSIDFLVSIATLYILIKIFKTNNQNLWYYAGIVLGLGLMNKLTILFFGFGIFVSILLVHHRKMLKSKQIWFAGIISLLFLIPYLIWQSQNDWYFINFASNYAGGISYIASFPEFVWNQILPNNTAALPVWLIGLFTLLFSSKNKNFRFFGIMYLFLFFLYFILGAKFYFLVPMYSVLLATGAVKIEERLVNLLKIRIVVPVVFVILSTPLIPYLVPVFNVEYLVKYVSFLGVDVGVKLENKKLNNLPQHFADRFGWSKLVMDIAFEFNQIPREERNNAGIITNNWGIASAIHFYKNVYNLPEPISNAGWYYFEALKKNINRKYFISVGISEQDLKNVFENVTLKRIFTNSYCMPHENNRPIFFCENLKIDLNQLIRVERTINPSFYSILMKDGAKKAIQYYETQKYFNEKIFFFTEAQINHFGYDFLNDKRFEDAILLFELNIKTFPKSFNVYDSYAEALMKVGRFKESEIYYLKSIELNPKNENGKKKLRELSILLNKQGFCN